MKFQYVSLLLAGLTAVAAQGSFSDLPQCAVRHHSILLLYAVAPCRSLTGISLYRKNVELVVPPTTARTLMPSVPARTRSSWWVLPAVSRTSAQWTKQKVRQAQSLSVSLGPTNLFSLRCHQVHPEALQRCWYQRLAWPAHLQRQLQWKLDRFRLFLFLLFVVVFFFLQFRIAIQQLWDRWGSDGSRQGCVLYCGCRCRCFCFPCIRLFFSDGLRWRSEWKYSWWM